MPRVLALSARTIFETKGTTTTGKETREKAKKQRHRYRSTMVFGSRDNGVNESPSIGLSSTRGDQLSIHRVYFRGRGGCPFFA